MKTRIDNILSLSEALKSGRAEQLKIISADIRVDYQQLINKLNFSNDRLNLEQLLDYLEHQGVKPEPFLRALCSIFGCACFAITPVDGMDELFRQMSSVAKEVGDVARKLNEAAADGKITREEKIQFAKEISEAVSALARLQFEFEEYC